MEPIPAKFPRWSSPWIEESAVSFERTAEPSLGGLAIITSATAVVGFAQQHDTITLEVWLRCLVLGFALWLIARTFWKGAWLLPAFETKNTLKIYAVVAVLGFGMFAAVSVPGSLGATGGGIAREVTQSANIDKLANAGQEFAAYVDQMAVTHAALLERRDQANATRDAEIAGAGPTGAPGPGPVSNAFGAAGGKYQQGADLLGAALGKAKLEADALSTIVQEMRDVQADPALAQTTKSAQLKALSGQAIGKMRALLALDPARSIAAAAAIISEGVPQPNRANPSSRERIADLNAEMTAYATTLVDEARLIAGLAPAVPELTTLSPSERLFANMWRMPGLTMAALLMDLCGWIAVGFRVAIYQALKAKLREEAAKPAERVITASDFEKIEHILLRAEESRRLIEDLRPTAKRGRPPLNKSKGRGAEE